jgi:hypothetical protein
MTEKIDEIEVELLEPGDVIRLLFMGGTEDVTIKNIYFTPAITYPFKEPVQVTWEGWSSVAGELKDTVPSGTIVRWVNDDEDEE